MQPLYRTLWISQAATRRRTDKLLKRLDACADSWITAAIPHFQYQRFRDTMGDFHIKKIILPSGKSVEIVYFHAEDALPEEADGTLDLECCPECDSGLVYPTSWRETEDDCWEIELRCPNCEWAERGVYRHQDVERFDDVLNRGTDKLIDELESLTRTNMEADIDRFVQALDEDLITPFDF